MRNLLLLVFFIPMASTGALKEYSKAEVSKHFSENDCWIILKSKVYDISSYVPKHPGPKKVVTKYCGKQADKGWETKDKKEPHSKAAMIMLNKMGIGFLKKEE